MFNLRGYKARKLYGPVSKGWHEAKIDNGVLRDRLSRKGKKYKYVRVDLEIIDEDGVLVAAFFFYHEDQNEPDPLFGKLLAVAGMNDDYRDDHDRFFRDLIGRKVRVKIMHRYKKVGDRRERREQVVDFEPIDEKYKYEDADEIEDLEDESGNSDHDDIPF